MNKVVAIVLSLILLLALFPVVSVVKAEKVTTKPFYAVTFQGVTVDTPYLYEMISIYTPAPPRQNDYKNETDINKIAQMIKEEMDARPEGSRFINFEMLRATSAVAEHIVYMDEPIRLTREWLTKFLSAYKSIGGKLDGILVDLEYVAPESWDLCFRAYKTNKPTIYQDIVNDPRYATRIRPMLEERGFKFWHDNSKPEIWGIYVDASGEEDDADGRAADYAMCGAIWNNVISDMLADAINQSTFEPLMQYYPDAILSDYQRADFNGWLKHLTDSGSVRLGNLVKAGNTSNYNTYTNRISDYFYVSRNQPVYKNIPGYNNAVFGSDPFNMTLWDTNLYKTIMSATTDTNRINAWVGGYTGYWGRDNICTSANTPYYTETLFHIGMLNPQPFIAYMTKYDELYDPDDPNNEYDVCLNALSDILEELTRVGGTSDRKPIETPATWNGNYVLSGMYAGGRNIWRITPNTAVKSLKDFKVSDRAPTFSIDGQTIVFPQGRIIETGDVRVAGSCGYWIETPADVVPVITSETDRYSKYPAYLQDFEKYTGGTSFNKTTAMPEGCWEVTGDTLKVEINGGTKMLAMTGTATVQNVKLPQNVTAGDSYAKQQAWEVSFTLPAGLNANAELRFLATTENGGGVLIKNGKVYYEKSGTYEQMACASLSSGIQYTVKREVDFRTAGAFTSSYYIYDSTGALLGEAKNIPTAIDSLPVTSIYLSCANVNKKVFVDNYKLYATGVTTDFELYDVKLGYKLGDVTEARTEDTAYRLSWMNATNAPKVAYIYNVQTGVIVETVKMKAGQDGVVTGIAKVKAGSSLQLAVRVDSDSNTSLPDYNNGDFDWEGFLEIVDPSGTEPTTPPTIEATIPPETEPDATQPDGTTPDATQQPDGITPDETQPNGTTPGDTQPNATNPDETNPGDDNTADSNGKKGLASGWVALIVIACVIVTAGGAVAVLVAVKGREAAKEILLAAWLKAKSLFVKNKTVSMEETTVIPSVENADATDAADE